MSKRMFGIDFGTSMFKIYKKGTGIVLDEKNVIALSKTIPAPGQVIKDGMKKKTIAGGNAAFEMFEKAPANIKVTYPVKSGVIAEIENMQVLFNYFLQHLAAFNPKKKVLNEEGQPKEETDAGYTGKISGAEYLVAIPTDITEVEKRAFHDLIRNSVGRPKKIYTVEKPIATAIGIGLNISNARGVMTIDIGADTTELSIMSLGGIVLSKLIPIGGSRLDESIKLFVKKQYNLIIGDKTAEMIKKELASAYDQDQRTMKVYGRNIVTGLPTEMEISSAMIFDSIKEHLRVIVDSIKVILERTPPEISADIISSGIYVTGGSAKIRDIDKLISNETELKVNISGDCENSVINGLGIIMDKNMTELMKQPDYALKRQY